MWIKNFKKHYCLCEQKEFKCWIRFTESGLTYNAYAKVVPPSVRMFWTQKFMQAKMNIATCAILLSIYIILS